MRGVERWQTMRKRIAVPGMAGRRVGAMMLSAPSAPRDAAIAKGRRMGGRREAAAVRGPAVGAAGGRTGKAAIADQRISRFTKRGCLPAAPLCHSGPNDCRDAARCRSRSVSPLVMRRLAPAANVANRSNRGNCHDQSGGGRAPTRGASPSVPTIYDFGRFPCHSLPCTT